MIRIDRKSGQQYNRRAQRKVKIGHHLCAGCHEPLSEGEISEGAELCSNCELGETGTAMIYDLEE